MTLPVLVLQQRLRFPCEVNQTFIIPWTYTSNTFFPKRVSIIILQVILAEVLFFSDPFGLISFLMLYKGAEMSRLTAVALLAIESVECVVGNTDTATPQSKDYDADSDFKLHHQHGRMVMLVFRIFWLHLCTMEEVEKSCPSLLSI